MNGCFFILYEWYVCKCPMCFIAHGGSNRTLSLKGDKNRKELPIPLFNLCSVIAQEHSERRALAQMLRHTSPRGLPSVVTANSSLEDTWAVLYILEINSKKKRQSELAESILASENLNPKTSGIQLFLKLRMSSSIFYCHFKSVMREW